MAWLATRTYSLTAAEYSPGGIVSARPVEPRMSMNTSLPAPRCSTIRRTSNSRAASRQFSDPSTFTRRASSALCWTAAWLPIGEPGSTLRLAAGPARRAARLAKVDYEDLEPVLKNVKAPVLLLYGKGEVRPGRKLGHVNAVAADPAADAVVDGKADVVGYNGGDQLMIWRSTGTATSFNFAGYAAFGTTWSNFNRLLTTAATN